MLLLSINLMKGIHKLKVLLRKHKLAKENFI